MSYYSGERPEWEHIRLITSMWLYLFLLRRNLTHFSTCLFSISLWAFGFYLCFVICFVYFTISECYVTYFSSFILFVTSYSFLIYVVYLFYRKKTYGKLDAMLNIISFPFWDCRVAQDVLLVISDIFNFQIDCPTAFNLAN